jgi:hypothetical protein
VGRGPGKWQTAILTELGRVPIFLLLPHFDRLLGRSLTPTEATGLRRAAKALRLKGACRVSRVWDDDCPDYLTTVVARQAIDLNGVECVRHRTGPILLLEGLRRLAAGEGMTRAQVARELVASAGPMGTPAAAAGASPRQAGAAAAGLQPLRRAAP